MTGWHALVPIKQGAAGKSRLAGVLDYAERLVLVRAMAARVLGALARCDAISSITILSPERADWWHGAWLPDHHRGLNPELSAWRAGLQGAPALVVHADVPLVSADDLSALLQLADRHGAAMATDRAGQGTNALAINRSEPFNYCFGPNSRAQHVAQHPAMPVLRRLGLIADLDTPDDLEFVQTRGFGVRQACHWEGPMPRADRHNHQDITGGECVR
ncbi:2-phospho-L-lactate guanylyltransferase [Novosphingobium sp. AAP93]|uniref:2-phospho-L-lactate guanylyltransferase n=1 Tax=Novosphingobium sp. AAP93 TaxID=1523427 RepID=UPI0006B9C682|nr:2-phospho-L-lactate guanylyltransferase [Novosphingobium sp. AAP93]